MFVKSLFTIVLALISLAANAEITTDDEKSTAEIAGAQLPSVKWMGNVCYWNDQVVPLVHAQEKCGDTNKNFAAVLKTYKKQKLPTTYPQEAGLFNLGGNRAGKVWCVNNGLNIKYPSPSDCRDYCTARCMPVSGSGDK